MNNTRATSTTAPRCQAAARRLRRVLMTLALTCPPPFAQAAGLIIPSGNLVAGYSGAEANGMFLSNTPPFTPPVGSRTGVTPATLPWAGGLNVAQTVLTTPLVYMRFYDNIQSGPTGRWGVPASAVRGLTPAQVQNGLALPAAPTMMGIGIASVGVNAYTGVAGPIAAWGNGGLQQTFLNTLGLQTGTFSWVYNKQAVMDCILCYDRMATTRNAQSVGRYLVAHTPAGHSDMAGVYDVLDTLFIADQAGALNSALEQIGGGARFDDLMTAGSLAVRLQNRTIDGRIDGLLLRGAAPTAATRAPTGGTGETGVWAQALYSNVNERAVGFDGELAGLILGIDTQLGAANLTGASLGMMSGRINWTDGAGHADTDYFRLAGYSAWTLGKGFLQATGSLGYRDGDSTRGLLIAPNWVPPPANDPNYNIPASPYSLIARTAQGQYHGWDADLNLRGGRPFHSGATTILPTLSAGYLYQSRNAFQERGAGSLDLNVATATAQWLLARAECSVMREFLLAPGRTAYPYLSLGVGYTQRLDDRRVSTSLNAWPDRFNSDAPVQERAALLAGAGVAVTLGTGLSISVNYLYEGTNEQNDSSVAAGLRWAF